MAWRGSVTVADRFWAALPYILPIAKSMGYAGAFVQLIPITAPLIMPIGLIGTVYYMLVSIVTTVGLSGSLAELLIFFALFIFVVRNPKLPHFIRYNTMLAMMVAIMIALTDAIFEAVSLSVSIVTSKPPTNPLEVAVLIFFAVMFVFAAGAYCYSLFNVAQGKYAEIKWISDAAYSQTQM
jgi:hypothetical protein